jgi:Na+-driven multidrug efflux pump
VVAFLSQALPLFLGSLLELGEWEVLVLFVSHLGGAEVATWAVMGGIWEILEAMTEGLGEAASVRVSYYLAEGLPHDARRLAHKVAFMSLILVLGVTSIFLMAGPNIAVTLSTDYTIQHLFTNLVGATGLANVSMTFAQIYWSLAGAQGRFGLASATILLCRWLVMLPIASICIFRYRLDLVSVGCVVALGYAMAACALAYAVFSSFWAHLAYFLRDDLEPMEDGVDGYHDNGAILDEVDDAEEEESESSEGDESSDSSESTILDEPKTYDDDKRAIDLDLL